MANLDRCLTKIAWAEKRTVDLQDALKAFGEANPQRISPEFDDKTGILSLVFRECKKPPLECSLLIGEIVHQQRSALDHLVWQLLESQGITPTDKSGFPICTTIDNFDNGRRQKLGGLDSASLTKIRDVQPFHRGSSAKHDPLWMLQELNNADKHRFIIITRSIFGEGFGVEHLHLDPPLDLKAGARMCIKQLLPVEDGRVLAWFETEQRETDVRGNLPISIVFSEIGPTKDKPVIPLLMELSAHVRGIIQSFSS